MATVKLKPCPFCGSEAEVRSMRADEDAMDTWVECSGCFATTDRIDAPYSEPSMAAALWNIRVESQDRQAGS